MFRVNDRVRLIYPVIGSTNLSPQLGNEYIVHAVDEDYTQISQSWEDRWLSKNFELVEPTAELEEALKQLFQRGGQDYIRDHYPRMFEKFLAPTPLKEGETVLCSSDMEYIVLSTHEEYAWVKATCGGHGPTTYRISRLTRPSKIPIKQV